jgi:hypothetical protein
VRSASAGAGSQSSVADEPEAAEWAMQGNLSAHSLFVEFATSKAIYCYGT